METKYYTTISSRIARLGGRFMVMLIIVSTPFGAINILDESSNLLSGLRELILFLSARIRVDGQSMEPTFHHGNFVIVNKLAYRLGDFQYGDVIVFPSPDNHSEDLIKRVIALPGDRIRITNNQVFINDFLMSEPYIKDPPTGDLREVTIPPGTVYVMGDNRNNSSDSRRWGPLQTDDVLGKAVFVYWPFSDFGLVQQFEFVFGG